MKRLLHKVSLICFNVFAVLFGFMMLFNALCADPELEDIFSRYAFGVGRTEIKQTGKQPVYFKSWYQNVEDLMAGSGEYAAAAEAEGAVLLKNEKVKGDQPALPLNTKTDTISLFGSTAYKPMYSLTGAGKCMVNEDRQQFFKSEFERAGLTVNAALAEWYDEHPEYQWQVATKNQINIDIQEAPWENIGAAKTEAGYNTAVYVIGRMSNEGVDLPPDADKSEGKNGLTDGDYLKLTAAEQSVLTGLKAAKENGTFDRVVVLINAANPIQEDFIDNPAYGIDAALWIGFPGTAGIAAVADILVGTTTPSGRLSTTWYANRKANPTWNYFGTSSRDSVLYQEGVYVGYKYAETRYEDYVMGTPNAGEYDYDANVNYPFGYGLSYADFSYEFLGVEKDTRPVKNLDYKGEPLPADERRADGDDYIAKVKVTNRSVTAGKEVVQIYLQQPYTQINREHRVEKPAAELVGFAKTGKLGHNESETVEIRIDANKYFAAFDIEAGKYVLDAGTYYLTAAKDAHDAVNNFLTVKGKANAAKMSGTGNAALVKTVEVTGERAAAYEYWTQGGAEVTTLFDHADPNKCDPDGNVITFMSRSDWEGTVSDTKQVVAPTEKRQAGKAFDKGNGFGPNSKTYGEIFEDVYPTYGRELDEDLNLVDMRGVEYEERRGASADDIKKWEDFLDQLTWDETVRLVGSGRRCTEAIDSIAKPRTNDVNASNGIAWKFNMKLSDNNANDQAGFSAKFDASNRDLFPTGYPCEGIIAATFNVDLAYVVGQSIGEDALWSGASGLYGFGLNIHRNPYLGRVGEYYSEDAFLTGVVAGWSSKGAQSKGLFVYNKHFVLNDMETNRSFYETWLTEQTLRQCYLRPFEIAIEIGDAMNVMTAFNQIGTYWSGNDYNLMTKCLRGELGMRGFAVTDWWQSGGMNLTYGMLAGQDLPDGNGMAQFNNYGPDKGDYGFLAQAMRRSARRILYTVANSNAMNFFGEGTEIKTYDPPWFAVRTGLTVTTIVLFSLGAAFLVATSVWLLLTRGREKKSYSML